MGIQGFESAFTFLDIVGQHRENGIRREDVEERLVDRYGQKGSHFTGYYRKLFGSLGMIEAKNDPEDGRKARYFPLYPDDPE
jgi:DNA repair ATPase RecN